MLSCGSALAGGDTCEGNDAATGNRTGTSLLHRKLVELQMRRDELASVFEPIEWAFFEQETFSTNNELVSRQLAWLYEPGRFDAVPVPRLQHLQDSHMVKLR